MLVIESFQLGSQFAEAIAYKTKIGLTAKKFFTTYSHRNSENRSAMKFLIRYILNNMATVSLETVSKTPHLPVASRCGVVLRVCVKVFYVRISSDFSRVRDYGCVVNGDPHCRKDAGTKLRGVSLHQQRKVNV